MGRDTGRLGRDAARQGEAAHVRGVRIAAPLLGARVEANVNAHMFRHALAQALVETSGLAVAQEVLGHRHIATTADTYCHVDQQAMVDALVRAKKWCDLDAQASAAPDADSGFAFAYDQMTLAELEAVAGGNLANSNDR